jgi:aminoglycoside/choline kinase family phosphotransferase
MTQTSERTTPTALDALDVAWFDQALRPALPAGTRITAVAVEPLAVAGAAGELGRVRLTYDADAAPGPESVIAKFRGTSDTQRAMDGALGIFARERRFYAEVAPLLPVAVPACHFAGDGDRSPLLLEDLCALRMGDQVAGLAPADAERLVDVLADLHARFWEQPIPGGSGWTVSLQDPLFAGMLTQLITSGVPALRERYAGRVPEQILAAIEAAAPRWAEVLARCDEGPRTLVHNDCRLDNVFFRPDGEPVLIDWQLPGHTRGTQDVAYLLSGSIGTAALRESWEPLLRRYHERLLAAGVTGYGWEQCLVHYRQSLLYTLAPGVAMLGAMAIAGDDRGLADTLVLRTLTHAAELDAFGTL